MKNLETNFDKLWDYSNPTETRKKFEDYLSGEEQYDLDYLLQLKTQIARTYSLKAEFADAHNQLDEVEKSLDESTPIAKVRYLLERGRTHNSAREKEIAQRLFIDAFESSKELALDNYTIDAAHMVALALSNINDKLEWIDKGVEIARESKNSQVKRWIGVFLNNSGWDLFEVKRYEEALEKFRECESFHRDAGNKGALDIARWSVAKAYRFLGRLDDSLEIQETLLEEGGGTDDSGYTYEELAELYLLREDEQKAREYFAKCYSLLSQDTWLQKHESERLERIKKLSM